MNEACNSQFPLDEDQIKAILARDDKDEFISISKRSLAIPSVDAPEFESRVLEFSKKLLTWVCHYRAVQCGTALVEGRTGLKVDLNIPINCEALPLHEAASSLSAPLVKLFLGNGAHSQVDVRSEILPLCVALRRASSEETLIQWNPSQSIFKLIIILCLPRMREALETIRLLACNTKEIREVVHYCASKDKIVELAILLMVARKEVMGPIRIQGSDHFEGVKCMTSLRCTIASHQTYEFLTTFRHCAIYELAQLVDDEYCLLGLKDMEFKKMALKKKNKEVTLRCILLLLEIFERAGDKIEAYLQLERANVSKEHVARDVARILKEACFSLNSKDTDLSNMADCYSSEMIMEQSDHSDIAESQSSGQWLTLLTNTKMGDPTKSGLQQQDFVHKSLNSKRGDVCHTKKPSHGGVPDIPRIRFPVERFSRTSKVRPFRPSWVWKAGFCTGVGKATEVEPKKGVNSYVRNLPTCRRWVPFALLKRGIRFI